MNLKTAHRPMKYSEVVGQDNAKKILSAESKKGTHSASYIFAGQYGGGKTTLARIHAMAVNCEHPLPNGDPCCQCASCRSIIEGSNPDVKEIAAAEDNGVSMAKRLSEDVIFSPVQSKVKVYILDEAHALSGPCWQVMLKVLEEAPDYTMFIMCTTEISKVPAPVRSRSLICNFYKLQMDKIAVYLKRVAHEENRELSLDACKVIAKQSEGSMRNALGTLEKLLVCTEAGQPVEMSMVKEISGLGSSEAEFRIMSALLNGQERGFIRELTAFAENTPLDNFLSDLLSITVDAAILKAGGKVFGWSEYVSSLTALISNVQLDKLISLSGLLVSAVQKKETMGSVVLGEMLLAFKEISALKCGNGKPVTVEEPLEPCAKEEVAEVPINSSDIASADEEDEKTYSETVPVNVKSEVYEKPVEKEEEVEEPSKRSIENEIRPNSSDTGTTVRDIEAVEAEISAVSKKEKLFKWLFLPAKRIYFREGRVVVVYADVDINIKKMMDSFIIKKSIDKIIAVE